MRAWKGMKGVHRAASKASDSSSIADAFSAVVPTVVQAPPKDFRVVRQEWAAIRIQTAFRGFLVKTVPSPFRNYSLRALKGVVRLQAQVHGRQVRKQATVTLRCMQALVRVQAHVRARRVQMSTEGQAMQNLLDVHRGNCDILKEAEEGWCDSQCTLDEVRAKLQMREEGAIKRERAIEEWCTISPNINPVVMTDTGSNSSRIQTTLGGGMVAIPHHPNTSVAGHGIGEYTQTTDSPLRALNASYQPIPYTSMHLKTFAQREIILRQYPKNELNSKLSRPSTEIRGTVTPIVKNF